MFLAWFPQGKISSVKEKEPLSCLSRLADRDIIRLMSVVQTGVIFPSNFLQYLISPLAEIQLMIYKRNTTLMPIKSSWQHHFRPGNAPYHLLCHTHFSNYNILKTYLPGRHLVIFSMICSTDEPVYGTDDKSFKQSMPISIAGHSNWYLWNITVIQNMDSINVMSVISRSGFDA